MRSIILPFNKSKQIMEESLSGNSVSSYMVAVEQPAASFTFHPTVVTGTHSFCIFEVGDHADDKILLYRSPLIEKVQSPISVSVPCNGPILIVVEYSGTMTYTVRGKAINTGISIQQVTETSAAQVADRQLRLINLLECNNTLLEKVVNHLRHISGIESDEGDTY
jgi:hypothetical protein